MLSILERHRDSQRQISRRELLSVGSLGLGGLTLPALLSARAHAGSGNSVLSGKSVILCDSSDPRSSRPS